MGTGLSPKEGPEPEAGSEFGFCSNPGFSFAGAFVLKVNHNYIFVSFMAQ